VSIKAEQTEYYDVEQTTKIMTRIFKPFNI